MRHLLLRTRIAIELAEQGIAVFVGPVGKLLDEVLNLFPAGLSKRLRAAEIDGIGLDQFGVELVLADDLAETIADSRASTVAIAIRILGRKLLDLGFEARPDLLDRADADAVGLAQGTIDGSGFGHPHFGAADERGNVRGIGVTVADETPAGLRLEDSGHEGPTLAGSVREFQYRTNVDTSAPVMACQTYQTGVSDVPSALQQEDVSGCN